VRVSVGYTMDTMYFRQLSPPVDVDKDVQMPQFKLIDKFVNDCSQNYTTGTFSHNTTISIDYKISRRIFKARSHRVDA